MIDRRTLLALAALPLAIGVARRADGATPLDGYRWQRRLLLVFAPLRIDPRLAAQRMRLRAARSGVDERDLTIVEIVRHSVLVDGRPMAGLRAAELRARYAVSNAGFATVLIGKDGGEKMRRAGLMATDTLFRIIDAMPMRRREMRRQ